MMKPNNRLVTYLNKASHIFPATLLLVFLLAFDQVQVSAFCKPITSTSISSKTQLYQTNNNEINPIRYLGSGPSALIRPGVVLVAPKHEYDHFLMKSTVFIYAIGLDDNQDMVARGVIIDHPTAFTVGEMSPLVSGAVSNNLLFRGGNSGKHTAMMLHSAGGPDGPIPNSEMIGDSGIYEGGIVQAMEAVDAGIIDADRCKFFFNYMQFREMELDDMFADVEDGDAWASLEVPVEYVLDSDLERGGMWVKLHNAVKKFRESE